MARSSGSKNSLLETEMSLAYVYLEMKSFSVAWSHAATSVRMIVETGAIYYWRSSLRVMITLAATGSYLELAARLYGIWPWLFDALMGARIARRNERLQSGVQGSDGARARAAQQGNEAEGP